MGLRGKAPANAPRCVQCGRVTAGVVVCWTCYPGSRRNDDPLGIPSQPAHHRRNGHAVSHAEALFERDAAEDAG